MKKWLKYFVSGAAALTLSLGLVAGCAPDKTATASESGVVRAFALIDEEGLISKTARADGLKYRVTSVTATAVREYSIGRDFVIEHTDDLTAGKQSTSLLAALSDAAEPDTSEPGNTDPAPAEPAPSEPAPAEPGNTETDTAVSALERAYAEALRLSGIAEADVAGFDFDRDTYMGKAAFKVEIEDAAAEYTFVFDAETFAVLASKSELRHTMSETDSSYIGEERAKALALGAVGIDAAAAEGLTVKNILSDGRRVYKVALNYGGYRYEADIDALSGDIVEFSKTLLGGATGPEIAGNITESEAKEIALAFAFPEGTGETVTFRKVQLDYEDGVFVYEVEFIAGGNEYELEIAAADGAILDAEIEREDREDPLPQGTFLSREEAMQAVQAVIGENARIVDIELETSGMGATKTFYYEVEVVDGYREYNYLVDAVTGAVTKLGEQESAENGFIGEERAIQIALEKFSLTEKEARVEKVKLERDDGRYIYEVELRVRSIEYEVEIDAETGKILESDISYD